MSHKAAPTCLTRRTYKRPYSKSTKGCAACKTRKIKCNEARPACSNCRKRFIDPGRCVYSAVGQGKPHISSDPSDTSMILQRPLSVTPTGLDSSHRLELRLMHHYTRSTCGKESLAAMVPSLAHPMWEIHIPQIAFSSDIVLNALLGISALNLLSLNPSDRRLALESRTYFNKAVSKHRLAVSHFDGENAEPILVAAVLIAHYTWLSAHSREPEEPYEVDLQTYHMCQGIQALVEKMPQLQIYSDPPRIAKDHSCESLLNLGFLANALQDIRILLASLDSESIDMEDKEIYKVAAAEVVKIYHLFTDGSDGTLIEQEVVTLLHKLPQRFICFLQENRPMALAILARNISLLGLVDKSDAWWIHGSGKWKVATKAAWGIRSLMPPEWLWTMDWPMKVISDEIKLDM